jgi:uncharacterized protein (DUF1330 family)
LCDDAQTPTHRPAKESTVSVYLVAHIDITDRDTYSQYEEGFLDVFAQFNGEFVAVDDDAMALEGEENFTRCVIVRFPDRESALAWYRSDAYQEIAAIRWAASTASITIIQALT